MDLKPEALTEVTIYNQPSVKLSADKKWEQQKLNQYKLEKVPIPASVNTADFSKNPIPYGPDLIRIGGMIAGLFSKEKEKPKEKLPEIQFKTLAQSLVKQQYYLDNLKLKEDEIDIFLQFCEADPKSYQVIKDNNILSMMDFLNQKNVKFKKL